ncbi:hypothetical protein [Paraglaciecola sp. 2405UD69-4]|uniref:hypothetical protein n=1 Tax=Paraglaciecola sp. 2405UD69-4 TaxID=3391836 RepID=UPI0039C9E89C
MKNLLATSISLIFILTGCQSPEEHSHAKSIQVPTTACDLACRQKRIERIRADHQDGPGTDTKNRHFVITSTPNGSKWRGFKLKIIPTNNASEISIKLDGKDAPILFKNRSRESTINEIPGGIQVEYPFYYQVANSEETTDDAHEKCEHIMNIAIFDSPFNDGKHSRAFFFEIHHFDELNAVCHTIDEDNVTNKNHHAGSSSGGGRN